MSLRLNGSNSGFTEVTAPATAGDNTITLPASNGSANQFLKNSGTAGTLNHSSMVEDSSGRLLVGTSTARTDVSTTAQLQLEGTSQATSTFSIVRNSNDAGRPTFVFGKTRGTSTGAVTAVSNNDLLGVIEFLGSDGTDLNRAAFISAEVDGTPGTDDMPGRLVFSTTADGASTPTERMSVNSNGFVNVGTQAIPSSTPGVQVTGSGNLIFCKRTNTGEVISFFANTSTKVGNIVANSSSTTYNTSSDYRLKENIVDLDGAIDRVKQLAPKRFNFIEEPKTTVDGFLAHEAQTVVPEAITGTHNGVEVWKEDEKLPDGVSVGDNKLDEDGNTIPDYQGIDQSKLVPLLTAALQEAIGKIETLETQHADLLARVTALEAA